MHFSIPDTVELTDKTGSTYAAYSIYANGVFHSTLRYRQLNNFYDQLRKTYGANNLPFFPPKKLLPLTQPQLEERRVQIEKFIQIVSQDGRIVSSELFTGFFLAAQQEVKGVKCEDVEVQVFLPDGHSAVQLKVKSTDRTSLVLEAVAKELSLPPAFLPYFTLFVARREPTANGRMSNGGSSSSSGSGSLSSPLTLLRRLQEFEAPHLTLLTMNGNLRNHVIVIRKCYWDSTWDDDLLLNDITMELLYQQTLHDLERGWITTNRESRKMLRAYQEQGNQKDFIELARTLRFYGYLHFDTCTCDYPDKGTPVMISVGGKELLLRTYKSASEEPIETSFRVTRIRCWRLTTSHSDNEQQQQQQQQSNGQRTNGAGSHSKLELSFEYLMNKDQLRWITVVSDQAIMISICLQSMVDELICRRKGLKVPASCTSNGSTDQRRGSWSYMKRDGSSHQLNKMVRSMSNDSGFVENGHRNGGGSAVKYNAKKGSITKTNRLVENDAFDGIGDEDL